MSRLPMWRGQHLAAIRAIIVMTVITGVIYPLAVMGIGQAAFHDQATGSMVTYRGRVVGSSLVCQGFTDAKGNPLPQYFQPRPSTAGTGSNGDYGCDMTLTGSSQLGTDNTTLLKQIGQRKAAIAAEDGVPPSQVPPDAVTDSASGLDPYISPRNAAIQQARVARARNLPVSEVRALVVRCTLGRTLGFLGEPRVNVLLLNIALDELRPGSRG